MSKNKETMSKLLVMKFCWSMYAALRTISVYLKD